MKILVLGSGGREHALSFRLSLDPNVESVCVFPGNPGMKQTPKLNVLGGEVKFDLLMQHIREQRIDFVVIGPEKFLFEGYVDQLKGAGIPAFGPAQAASFLEASKIKSKVFMKEFGIPTADFGVANTLAEAHAWIDSHPEWAGYVLKLSGPALGKGVVVVKTASEAKDAAQAFFHHRPAGIEDGVVIEEIIPGREVSLFYACDGKQGRFIASACDHKRLLDHDEGPNTGGMGAYSPCHWIDPKFLKSVEEKVVGPTLFGMNKRGTPFAGMLFLGLMVNAKGFSLLEYNTRFGDPETQAFVPIFNGNLSEVLFAAATGKLETLPSSANLPEQFSLHVVKAAKGYPGVFGQAIESGQVIEGTGAKLTGAHLFYAGVKEDGSKLVSSGGRVLGITGIGSTFKEAKVHAYENINRVSFSGEHFRTDIGGSP